MALKFDRHLYNATAEMPVKFQSNTTIISYDLAPSRLHEIWQYDILQLCEQKPQCLKRIWHWQSGRYAYKNLMSLVISSCKIDGHITKVVGSEIVKWNIQMLAFFRLDDPWTVSVATPCTLGYTVSDECSYGVDVIYGTVCTAVI